MATYETEWGEFGKEVAEVANFIYLPQKDLCNQTW